MEKRVELNKYGGYTWETKIPPYFRFLFHETNEKNFVVDFQEFKWIHFKTLWSMSSSSDLESTLKKAFDKLYDYFVYHSDIVWTESQKNNMLENKIKELRLNDYKNTSNNKIGDFVILHSFEFNKMDWDFDIETNLQIITFINSAGESYIIKKDLNFDVGSIIIYDTNKTINELIKGLNHTNIYLPSFDGVLCQISNGDLIIKGWNSDVFVEYQIFKEKNK